MSDILERRFDNNSAFEKIDTGLVGGPPTAYMTLDGKELYVLLMGHIARLEGFDWRILKGNDLQSALRFAIMVELIWRQEANRIKNGGVIQIVCKRCRRPFEKNPFDGKYKCFAHRR